MKNIYKILASATLITLFTGCGSNVPTPSNIIKTINSEVKNNAYGHCKIDLDDEEMNFEKIECLKKHSLKEYTEISENSTNRKKIIKDEYEELKIHTQKEQALKQKYNIK
jgi:hypothetical protein